MSQAPNQTKPIDPTQVESNYQKALSEFTKTLSLSLASSRQAAGLAAGERLYWGSALFTRLNSISVSILSLCPKSVLASTNNWDFASIASLIRNMFECYLMFFYLAIKDMSEEEWRVRLNVMQLHDHTERRKMFAEFRSKPAVSETQDIPTKDLHLKLNSNPFFSNLEPTIQKELLKGKRATILTNKQIASELDDPDERIWGLYRFFSCHTHSSPLSFYRMTEQKRDGTENTAEKVYVAVALEFATSILDDSVQKFQKAFERHVSFESIEPWELVRLRSAMPAPDAAFSKPTANSICSCGSGKKFRWCHGKVKSRRK